MNRDRRIVRLNEAFQYVDDEFLNLVEKEQKISYWKHMKKMKVFLSTAAACVCLMIVLPAVALAYNWFGLRNLIMPKEDKEYVSLTLGEYAGKPEVAALREWKQFIAEYDIDATLYAEAIKEGFSTEGREDWDIYGVYTYDMGETLDRIAEKYGLMLHTNMDYISYEELESLVGGNFMEEVSVENCRVYENGSLHFAGVTELNDSGTVFFRLSCAVKGTLDENIPYLGHKDGYVEWQYDTAGGESVRLVLGTYDTRILKESADRYIIVDMPYGSDHGITKENLQELAEKIDFGMLMEMQLPEVSRDMSVSNEARIPLSGYMDSPGAQALVEWQEFLAHYDTDNKIADEIGNGVFVAEGRDDWFMYSVYSYEMGEKLDEIANKYGLNLHNEVNIISRDELMYRVGGSFMATVMGGAYIYEDGSFHFEGDVELDRYGAIGFQLMRKVKGTFHQEALNIGQPEDYTEWQYITACGEPVLLELGSYQRSLIFADYEECFISVNVLAGIEDGLTKEDLQELADQIDFKILMDVRVPEMRGDSIFSD